MSWLHHRNALCLQKATEDAASASFQNLQNWNEAFKEISSWPEYNETPTWILENHAKRLGIGRLIYKDESTRFGRQLGSFKALGAPYTVFSLLAEHVETQVGVRPSSADLRSGKYQHITNSVTVCVATDGNQGRGLAYGARTFHCRCVVYIHNHVSPGRKKPMEDLGAIVIRISGEYEASVNRAREDARLNGWFFVSSTSWDDFASDIPRKVMNGYMVMVEEVLCALRQSQSTITHVFMCGGVGSIAAAVFMGLFMSESHQQHGHPNPLRFIVIEPSAADCLYQSSISGHPTPSTGTLHTIMAGLACREPSPAAYKILQWLTSDFVVVPDRVAVQGMKMLAAGDGDVPIVCGESSGANMGVLIEAANDLKLRQALGLTESSQVLIFGCEGATDPERYEEIVGLSPDAVFKSQSRYLDPKARI